MNKNQEEKPMLNRFPGIVLLLSFSILFSASGWPEFRGPGGTGRVEFESHKEAGALPLSWDETKNVTWKTSIPYKGWSTPAILDGKIWLTTASEDGHDFFAICVDAQTGEVLLNERMFNWENPEPLGNHLNSYASPSPVVEPGRVYLSFGSYGTACLNTNTYEVLWKRADLPCRHYRGPGSSPVLFGDYLILTMDGVDVQYLVALDKNTGKPVWKTDRTVEWNDLGEDGKPYSEGDLRKAFSTPLIIQHNGKTQLISLGSRAVYSYDPTTGKELWKVRHEAFSGAARPVFGEGLAIFSTGHGKSEIIAVRVDGQGDVTDTHVAWRTNRGAPNMPSPVVVDDLLFMLNDNGILTCLETKTGSEVWKQRLGGDYASSPLYANGRLYCFSQDGTSTVVAASRKSEELAINKLDSGFMASPAVAGQSFFLRTKTHLYKIDAAQ
jgi:outer membrane protein assembly factor BamB